MPPAVASKTSPAAVDALRMLKLFGSIGATHFDVTHTHLNGEKRGFRGNRSMDEVTRAMPFLVASAVERQNNVIIRPRVQGATCIQLDDIDAEKAARIAPAAFLTLQTSPGNYQAWVAVADAPTGTTARLRKGLGADLNASGATRVAGTRNYKPKYAPDFPAVRIADAQPGRLVTVADLEALQVLAPAVAFEKAPATPYRQATHKWPSYRQVLEKAPESSSRPGQPRESVADFTWCMMATSWGHSIEATAGRLIEESPKAKENGPEYARKTAERAAWAAQQRQRNRGMQP